MRQEEIELIIETEVRQGWLCVLPPHANKFLLTTPPPPSHFGFYPHLAAFFTFFDSLKRRITKKKTLAREIKQFPTCNQFNFNTATRHHYRHYCVKEEC
jgi:hypothetical protein